MSQSLARKSVSKSRKPWRRRSTPAPRCRHRRIPLGATYLVTKKCDRDEFLIRPSTLVNDCLLFLLVLKARRYRILIHGFIFMSNHMHLVVTDLDGNLPKFMREFLGESSKAVQVVEGTKDPIWSRRRVDYTRLLDADAAQRKIIYTILNPTKARLTLPNQWPGLSSAKIPFGSTITARRPDVYFSDRRPEEVSIELTPLSAVFEGLDEEQALADFEAELERELQSITRKMEENGERFLGPDSVLAQSRDLSGTTKKSSLRPRFATKNRELLMSAIRDYEKFETEHEESREKFLTGKRRVTFPPGTYGFRVLYGARVKPERSVA